MTTHKIIIIGSGFSGICIALKLKQAGIHDFIILEKASELGGTWRENSYPGAECDIPSALYSFSFEPNSKWKHVWSKRSQIFQYQKDVAEKYELMPHFRFNQRVSSAAYQDQCWHIRTQDTEYQAQHFVSAIGQLHERFTPKIDGMETFKGEQFHAAKWNHDVNLSDKNIAVIGSAASAVQLIPEIAKQAKQVLVFQRTPNWMIAKPNRVYSKVERWLAEKVPILTKIYRTNLLLQADFILHPALNGNPLAGWIVRKLVHRNLNKQIKDPALKAKLTPKYTIGAKRILFSDTFYKALTRDNIELETSAIQNISVSGVHTVDGRLIEADVIVYATGFITNPFFKSIHIEGREQSLKQAWLNGAQAYLGVYAHGFPNLHMMYGPNTNLGHNSIIIMIEAQSDLIVRNIVELHNNKQTTYEVPRETEDEYNQALQSRLRNMAFSKIGDSWYMDNGKITNNWAGNTFEYKKLLREVKLSNGQA